MPKPVTPMCGCDVFVTDAENRVLLVRRVDNGHWCLPGGCQNLDDTPAGAAVRECFEETGLRVEITRLLGAWSSLRYEYKNYPWKDNIFTHLVFAARVTGGVETSSDETSEVGWFEEDQLPPLCDGHAERIIFGFGCLREPELPCYYE